MKNVEKASAGGKFNPSFGLSNTGIAGTGADKEDDEAHTVGTGTATMPVNTGAVDEEMKDVSKKGDILVVFVVFILFHLISSNKLTFYKFLFDLTVKNIFFLSIFSALCLITNICITLYPLLLFLMIFSCIFKILHDLNMNFARYNIFNKITDDNKTHSNEANKTEKQNNETESEQKPENDSRSTIYYIYKILQIFYPQFHFRFPL